VTGSTRVLVVSHDAGRQGAPMVMLEMLRWFQANTEIESEVVLHMGGPLRPLLDEVARTTVLNPYLGSSRTTARIARRLASPVFLDRVLALRLRRRLQRRNFDVIWANSVASWRALDALALRDVPRVLHVHELEYTIRQIGPPPGRLASMADHFIAASNAVRENVVQGHGVPTDRVTVAYSSVPNISVEIPDSSSRKEGRAGWGIGPDDFVIVGCGAGGYLKGIDLLPALLRVLCRERDVPTMHLIWVGHVAEDIQELLLMDLEKHGVENALHFAGEVDDPRSLFCLGDVFVLPSREEALGLVCLEAAQCGLPTMCFADAGGAPEFVGDDAGCIVPYLDVEALADAIAGLCQNPELRSRLGRCAREKVAARFTIDSQAPRLAEVLKNVASRTPTSG